MRTPRNVAQRAFLALCLLVFPIASLASDAANRGFFWEVKGGRQPLYLLGSIHFGTADFYPFAPHVEQAFNAADNLVVEVDISRFDPASLQQLVAEKGMYRPPETIEDHLSPATIDSLKKYLANNGLSFDAFAQQRPGLVVMAITSLELARQGLSANQGIDLYFLNKAGEDKAVLELESIEDQFAVLFAEDYAEQMLKQTLDETARYDELTSELLSIWQQGDSLRLHQLLIAEPLDRYPDSQAAFDALFTRRNHKMLQKIISYLRSDESYFVVVGAGHLLGDSGIVTQLAERGFEVIRR